MQRYVAFLRSINVGTYGRISMSQLRDCLTAAGLASVSTYIQSGNVIFESAEQDKANLTALIRTAMQRQFGLDVTLAIFQKDEWQKVVTDAPAWWGKDTAWRHNIFILLQPEDAAFVVASIGALKPGLEELQAGNGVLYQSIAISDVGRGATGSKLVSNAAYRRITIRNYNTARKIAALLAA